MSAKKPDRQIYLHVPADTMNALLRIADEDGTSVTRLVQGWVEGRVRDYEKED